MARGKKAKGKVLHLSKSGKLIVRGTRKTGIGNIVRDKNKKIGKVYDVFGPVDSPYLSIRLFKGIKSERIREVEYE
jgi:RNA-binding protein